MSILKSALVACVMTTSAMLLGYMAPVVITKAHAQSFPPCVNDFRAEIASGQRSPHYPRCLDAHSPSNARLVGNPTRFDNLPGNCPSGQVYSGGACVTIQNQAGHAGSWVAPFLGQQKCDSRACVWIGSDGRLHTNYTDYQITSTANIPVGLSPVGFPITNSCDSDSCRRAVIAEPTINGQPMLLTGGIPNGWRFRYARSTDIDYNRWTIVN
jgi:hypothetical protein